MAKLSANGRFEIARIVLTKQHEDRLSVAAYALLSDGWVLRKVNGTGWKPLERQPGIKGHGPKHQHGWMPVGTNERTKYDARVQAMTVLGKRMAENFSACLDGWEVKYQQKA